MYLQRKRYLRVLMKDVNSKYVVKTEIGFARITIRRVKIKDTKTTKHIKERHHNDGGES